MQAKYGGETQVEVMNGITLQKGKELIDWKKKWEEVKANWEDVVQVWREGR